MIKRIQLVPTKQDIYKEDYNLTIELALNDDATPTRKMTAFGNFGSMGGKSNSEPFLLFPNGDLDFGVSAGKSRYDGSSNLMEGRAFFVGEYFTVRYGDDKIVYRVKAVSDPA